MLHPDCRPRHHRGLRPRPDKSVAVQVTIIVPRGKRLPEGLFETTTRTLFCGDRFTQLGERHEPVTEQDILEPSEEAR